MTTNDDIDIREPYHDTAKELSGNVIEKSSSEDQTWSRSTVNDERDMQRMGKVQQLRRNFRRFSALCFVCVLTATWEYLFVANTPALIDGGRAGFLWTYVWTAFGMGLIIVSLAEASSMAPTSGGQYHWISEFAPVKCQQFLSYTAGWLSTLSWQAATAAAGTLTGGITQGLIAINNPSYTAPAWHLVLISIANVIFVNTFNVYCARFLAPAQNLIMVFHVFALIAIIVVLWALAPHPSAGDVFGNLENLGGWSSMGLALCIGQISALYGLLYNDAAAHIAEEVKDAGRAVPQAMFGSYVINSVLGLILIITYLFAMPSVEDAINDPSGFPFLYVFQQAMPLSGTNGLTAIILFLLVASSLSFNASTVRQTFAFARDKGLPFSTWIGHVDKRLKIPANAVWFTMTLSILLNLIGLGSTSAFNALVSLQLVALFATYMVSTSSLLWARLYAPEKIPPARWSLGKLGGPINAAALVYSCFAFFFCFWPVATPVSKESFNWSVAMFVGVMTISMILFVFRGRHVYKGPVVTVEGFLAERRLEGFGPNAS